MTDRHLARTVPSLGLSHCARFWPGEETVREPPRKRIRPERSQHAHISGAIDPGEPLGAW
ncbi:MAG: hypothetical protein RJA70_2903 [Pseudomonadota bacterium]|jgi:hypothetical protein